MALARRVVALLAGGFVARRVTEPLAMLPSARLATGQNRHNKLYSIPESGQ
jgi:hypothetical protein